MAWHGMASHRCAWRMAHGTWAHGAWPMGAWRMAHGRMGAWRNGTWAHGAWHMGARHMAQGKAWHIHIRKDDVTGRCDCLKLDLDTTKLSNEILDMRIGGQVPEQIAAVHFKVWFVEVLAHRLNEQVEILGVCELEHLVRVVRDARHELHGGNEARSFRARCIDHHERALKVPAVEHALQDPLVFRHSDGGAQSVSQVVPVE
eukprot:790658-Amorphochlora_amoeboformis.AAC.1